MTGQFICRQCVSEPDLAAIIHARSDCNEPCDYCGSTPSADFQVLVAAFLTGVDHDYRQADDEGVPWDGGYQGAEVIDSWDLVFDIFPEVSDDETVLKDLFASIPEQPWARRDGWHLDWEEELRSAWDRFVHAVKFETRFVYWATPPAQDELFSRPGSLLVSIERTLQELKLIESTRPPTLWRARPLEKGWDSWTSPDLGTPPVGIGRANRFSPEGISYFYASESPSNAAAELAGYSTASSAALGEFELDAPITVADLTRLPVTPSIFNAHLGHLRRDILFLHEFVNQISAPHSGASLDYVPTQVVAEYFMRGVPRSPKISGIRYKSSLDATTACWVLDVANDHCINANETDLDGLPHLRMTSGISKIEIGDFRQTE